MRLCARCGGEVVEYLVVYDLERKEVTHTWPEMRRPNRRALRDISATFPLRDTEVLMFGEPAVTDAAGRVYHERCYHGG